jgi:hypothetical protein
MASPDRGTGATVNPARVRHCTSGVSAARPVGRVETAAVAAPPMIDPTTVDAAITASAIRQRRSHGRSGRGPWRADAMRIARNIRHDRSFARVRRLYPFG